MFTQCYDTHAAGIPLATLMSSHLVPAFDFADADVVLVSGDAERPVDFRLHRTILSVASPFFRDMFSLPQGSDKDEALPRIPMSETASVLRTLFQLVYPLPAPTMASLEELKEIMAVALKYDFDGAISKLRTQLVSPKFLDAAPLAVYATACRFELEDEAKIASRHTFGINLLDSTSTALCEDLKWISAYHYHKLLVLHRARSRAAIAVFDNRKDVPLLCMQCSGGANSFRHHHHTTSSTRPPTAKWWPEFEARAREELSARPTTDVVFGLGFLYSASAKAGCPRCPGSVLESWKYLMELKAAIDDLPSTV